jgi:hypothetical protein
MAIRPGLHEPQSTEIIIPTAAEQAAFLEGISPSVVADGKFVSTDALVDREIRRKSGFFAGIEKPGVPHVDAAHEIAGMDLNDIYAITRSDQLIDWLDHIKAVHAGFEAKTQLGLARKERVLPKQMELVHNFYFHRDRYLRNAVHSDERNSEEFDRVHDQTICSATLQSWKRVGELIPDIIQKSDEIGRQDFVI